MADKTTSLENGLLIQLGRKDLLFLVKKGCISYLDALDIAGTDCFMHDRKGPVVDVLRRAVRHIKNGICRADPIFLDNLERLCEGDL
jgi:hypothetical protein